MLVFLAVAAVLLLAAPAPGATGFGSLARKSFKTATEALGLAKSANKRSKIALQRADDALDFAEALGIDSETGADGPAGPQGETGATGPQGPAGPQGETGATGPQGPAGADGTTVDGQDGTDGTNGADGANGLDGSDGRSFTWEGAWDNATAYQVDDTVSHGGSTYIAVADSTGSQPPSADWELVAQKGTDGTNGTNGRWDERHERSNGSDGADGRSFTWEGAWDNATAYEVDDTVSYGGSTYVAVAGSTGSQPPSARLGAGGAEGHRRHERDERHERHERDERCGRCERDRRCRWSELCVGGRVG